MDFSYVHIRYFIGYVYHICLQDTIQSTLSLCLRCQAMLLPMPLRPLLLTTRSGFNVANSTRAELDRLGLTALRAMVDVEPYGSSDLGGYCSDDEPPSMTSASPSEDDDPEDPESPSGRKKKKKRKTKRPEGRSSRLRQLPPPKLW